MAPRKSNAIPKAIDTSVLEAGYARYNAASGWDDLERDEDGFVVLKPTASHVDRRMATLNTDIDTLEAKLKKYRKEQAETAKYQKSEEYKESKKSESKKKKKKKRETLINMVFNTADADNAEEDDEEYDEEDGSGYIEKKKRGRSKKVGNSLDTTYGMRFAPIMDMLNQKSQEFDQIAKDIEAELAENKNSARSMYRSSQMSNMLSAKSSSLSAITSMASLATTLSRLEYQKEKDKRAETGNQDKEVATMAARFLRGSLDDIEDEDFSKKRKKKGKKSKKEKSTKNPYGSFKSLSADDDDDDDDVATFGSISKSSKKSKVSDEEQKELALEFAKTLKARKDEIKLTPHEKALGLEGKYHVMVLCDPLDPSDSWKYVAIDNKSGKILKDDIYKDLLPKKKKARMRFDIAKGRATDLNSARTYKLMYKD